MLKVEHNGQGNYLLLYYMLLLFLFVTEIWQVKSIFSWGTEYIASA